MNTTKRLYDLLGERGMSVTRFCEESGISYSTLKTARRRGSQLSVETIYRVCEVLQITVQEFFSEEEKNCGAHPAR